MRRKNPEFYDIIKEFVNSYFASGGRSPSTAEISAGTGIPRPTVQRYLAEMRDRGEIGYGGHRGISTPFTQELSASNFARVGVVGTIACGEPLFAEENIEEYIHLPVSLVGNGTFFLLRADGDSMTGAGIEDGDLVLIKQQNTAEPGQIAVALIGDEATLKRYFPEPEHRRVRLHAENKAYPDILAASCLIQGIAVKVLKDIS